jgi:transposase-like protein
MGLPKTLSEAVTHFASADNCREFLVARRWPNGVACPACGSKSVYFDSGRTRWECKTRHPKRTFTLKTGTIFEDSPMGLDKWLPVVWMIANDKNGVSSWEIHRVIGVTQKTAWFMLQRIRLALQDPNGGGKSRFMHKAKRDKLGISQSNSMAGKVAVMGLLERHGEGRTRVRTAVIHNRKRNQLEQSITANVELGSTIYTDALKSDDQMGQKGHTHGVIDHAEAYVDGQIHTNGLEKAGSVTRSVTLSASA